MTPNIKNVPLLVTGGSGFLGWKLVERLLQKGAAHVTVLCRNEGNAVALKNSFPTITIMLGDISRPLTVKRALQGQQGVFHLAALKHVGIAEKQPYEAIKTNVLGTINLLEGIALQPLDFILGVSTDKAAQVSGVYGATKFLMESLFRESEERDGGFTNYRIVRYGNVLYSTGSVLCKWKEALQNAKPITITDYNATRFFWGVDQAVDLIFECLDKAVDSTPYIPVMKSMRMGDILEAMQLKYGRAVAIKEMGLGQGENLHEVIHKDHPTSDKSEMFTVDEILKLV